MSTTALDTLKSVRAQMIDIRDRLNLAIAAADLSIAAVPTTAELQDLLNQLMDAAPSVIKAVTPDTTTTAAPPA